MKTIHMIFELLWIHLLACNVDGSKNLHVTSIRLAGGSGPFEGRVEMQVDGIWGNACGYYFTIDDTTVMCKMMDLLPTAFFAGSRFGPDNRPIFAQEFDCNGYETDIGQCTFEPNGFCAPYWDVGIICSECGEIVIENGEVDSISTDGTILKITCDKGYEIDTNTSTCLNGSWSLQTLTCTRILNQQSDIIDIIELGFPLDISDIRFANSIGIADGRVELLVNGTWGTMCSTGFSTNGAKVICKMFGYDEVYAYYGRYDYEYGYGTGPVYLTNLDCNGTETHINNCTYDTVHSCSHYYDVAVVCKYQLNVTDIRLAGGTGPYDGRVEVFRNGIWGTACGRYDLEEIGIFCKMLNLNFTNYFANPVYGQGSEPILIGDLYCTGQETNVNYCNYNSPNRRNCNHGFVLTLVCTPCGQIEIQNGYFGTVNGSKITVKCDGGYQPNEYLMTCLPNGTLLHEEKCSQKYAYPLDIANIQLANSLLPTEGRVEISVDNVWGTICDNNFNSKSANVTCHMFGLQVQSYYINAAMYGSGTGPIYIDNLNCTGLESHINNCSYDVTNTCTHNDDVSVRCTGFQLNITAIRLAGTNGPYNGRIELEVNNTWGTVCDDDFSNEEAKVFCRMLGLEYRSYYRDAYYGEGKGPIYVDRLQCSGSESHINDCRHAVNNYYNCDHRDDASVMCYGPELNITGARLVNGTSIYDGRAEIKVNETWGTICDTYFNIYAADLFCDLLGLRAAQYLKGALYGEGSGPVLIDEMSCNAYEQKLSNCKYVFLNECSHARDVSVVCNGFFLLICVIILIAVFLTCLHRFLIPVNDNYTIFDPCL